MNKYTLMLLSLIFFLGSCSSGRMATTGGHSDDVYYSENDARHDQQNSGQDNSYQQPNNQYQDNNQGSAQNSDQNNERFSNGENQDQSRPYSTEQYSDPEGNTYVTNNYYDDYYDYSYSTRVRRFYHPVGWSYYDPYYTNMYWYDYNPYSWGVSIYTGYSFWNAGWGYPYYGYGYPSYGYGYGGGCGYPSYGCGYSCNSCHACQPYYSCVSYGSFCPNYFNSYDSYSYSYGPRDGRVTNNLPGSGDTRPPLSEIYGRNTVTASNVNTKPDRALASVPSDGMEAIGRSKMSYGAEVPNVRPGATVKNVPSVRNQFPAQNGKTQGTVPTRQNPVRDGKSVDTNSGGTRDVPPTRNTNTPPVRNSTTPANDNNVQPGRDNSVPPTRDNPVRDQRYTPVERNTNGPSREGGYNSAPPTDNGNSVKKYSRSMRKSESTTPTRESRSESGKSRSNTRTSRESAPSYNAPSHGGSNSAPAPSRSSSPAPRTRQ